jgi:hypothetical protein
MEWIENNDRIASVCEVEICIFCECGNIFPVTMTKREDDFAECPDCKKKYKVTATVYEVKE